MFGIIYYPEFRLCQLFAGDKAGRFHGFETLK